MKRPFKFLVAMANVGIADGAPYIAVTPNILGACSRNLARGATDFGTRDKVRPAPCYVARGEDCLRDLVGTAAVGESFVSLGHYAGGSFLGERGNQPNLLFETGTDDRRRRDLAEHFATKLEPYRSRLVAPRLSIAATYVRQHTVSDRTSPRIERLRVGPERAGGERCRTAGVLGVVDVIDDLADVSRQSA